MDSINFDEQSPVGSELFQDSESFLDELSYGWEIDTEQSTTVSIVISYPIGLQGLIPHFSTDSKLPQNSSFFNEETTSFHFINS